MIFSPKLLPSPSIQAVSHPVGFILLALCAAASLAGEPYEPGTSIPGGDAKGKASADQFLSSKECAECHVPEGEKWRAGFRPHAFDNPFVQAEYRLAWAKAKREGTGDGLPASCLACHSPILYLTGVVPKPGEKLPKGEEGIVCDFCHSTWGFTGETPGHFNWIFRKGGNRFGPMVKSALGKEVRWVKSPELCGTCHNEKGPGGHWVKSAYLEWKEGPYAKEGEKGCLDCHLKFTREFVDSMIPGAVSVEMSLRADPSHAGEDDASPVPFQAKPGRTAFVEIALTNALAGHKIPTGSSELRQLWLHVEAEDASGTILPLAVTAKGFEGEEFTIGSSALAYQDAGEFEGKRDFLGLPRDGEGISAGDRVFRLPMFDAKGRMTAFEWNAKSLGTDYRMPPRMAISETFRWTIPPDAAPGTCTVRATLSYRRVPPALWRFLRLPEDGNPTIRVAEAALQVQVGGS